MGIVVLLGALRGHQTVQGIRRYENLPADANRRNRALPYALVHEVSAYSSVELGNEFRDC